jgi:DNA ligase-1
MRYLELANFYQALEGTSKRLGKTGFLAELLKKTEKQDVDRLLQMVQGRVFPKYDESKLGVASRLVVKALNVSTGITPERIEEEWKKTGDLGLVAEKLIGKKKQATLLRTELSVKKVYDNLRALSVVEGTGSVDKKMALISELLTSAEPLEAKFIVRTMLEDLRVGVGEGVIREGIVLAYFGDELGIKLSPEKNEERIEDRERYNGYVDAVQHSFDVTNDFGAVALAALEGGITGVKKIRIEIGKPLNVMLAQKADNIEGGLETVGRPAQVEYKYDGFRVQVHKRGKSIKVFTRRLEDVTAQFPELVESVEKNVEGSDFILDGEAIGFDPKTKRYLPFQSVSQRIKRKYEIERLRGEMPVELHLFDVICFEGKTVIELPLQERWKLLEGMVRPVELKIVLAKRIVSSDPKEIEMFYRQALADSQEGVMMKNIEAPYQPGRRAGFMVKIKPVMESLDLVIVGAEWGEGKRSGWLTSYMLACVDDEGELAEVGKSSTGLKEKREEGLSFEEMTELLKPLIVSEKGKEVRVKPRLVIEVSYQEIQKSPTYRSGYALRFPTIVRLREDRGADEASTLSQVEEFYYGQKKK